MFTRLDLMSEHPAPLGSLVLHPLLDEAPVPTLVDSLFDVLDLSDDLLEPSDRSWTIPTRARI